MSCKGCELRDLHMRQLREEREEWRAVAEHRRDVLGIFGLIVTLLGGLVTFLSLR